MLLPQGEGFTQTRNDSTAMESLKTSRTRFEPHSSIAFPGQLDPSAARTTTPVVADRMRLSELHHRHGSNNAASVGGLHSDARIPALAIRNSKGRFIRLYHETTKASGAAGDIKPHPGTW